MKIYLLLTFTNFSQRNSGYFTKTSYFKPSFHLTKHTNEQQSFLTTFNFQFSYFNQQEYIQLAQLVLKYPMVYDAFKFDVSKILSTLHLPLALDAVFEKQQAKKITYSLTR